ncbi:unnamed protein product, partial [Prorocentrum cordatum]
MAAFLGGSSAATRAGAAASAAVAAEQGCSKVADFILLAGCTGAEDTDDSSDEDSEVDAGSAAAGGGEACRGEEAEDKLRRRRSVEVREQDCDLICPICDEVMYRPVRTQCDHGFCLPCLLLWLEEGASQSCPLCRGSLADLAASAAGPAASSSAARRGLAVDSELEKRAMACLGKEAYLERELDSSGPNLSRRVRAYRRKLDRLTDGSDVAYAGVLRTPCRALRSKSCIHQDFRTLPILCGPGYLEATSRQPTASGWESVDGSG